MIIKFNLDVVEVRKKIIPQLEGRFNTHQFIQKFAQTFEREYIALLVAHECFQQCHARIGKWLSIEEEALKIRKENKKVPSVNIFGVKSSVEVWNKV